MKLVESENEKENIEDLYKVGNVIKYRGQTYMVVLLSKDLYYVSRRYGLLCLDTGTLSFGSYSKIVYDSLSELVKSCGSNDDELLTGKVIFDMGD